MLASSTLRSKVVLPVALVCLVVAGVGAIAIVTRRSTADAAGSAVSSRSVVNDPGSSSVDGAAQTIDPVKAAQLATKSSTWHAPKPGAVALAPTATNCPLTLGQPGPVAPPRQDFSYADLITGAYWAVGSDGRFYELVGGRHRGETPALDASDVNAGFILVHEYPSASVNLCQPAPAGFDYNGRAFTTYDLPEPTGAVTLTGVRGDMVTYTTAAGAKGSFDFVTHVFG